MNHRTLKNRLLGWGIALALLTTTSAQARVDALTDRNEVALGEPIRLMLQARDAAFNQSPDLTPLEEDFEVLGVSRGSRTTIVNGQRDDLFEWSITLLPREVGDQVIPAISFGAESSDPLPVSVASAQPLNHPAQSAAPDSLDARPSEHGTPVTLSARIDESDPFVQEQVILTVRLESMIPITEGQIAEPQVEGALVERIGEDQQGSSDVDGSAVNWVERRYAIFPQQSGPMIVEPIAFEGLTPLPATARSRPSRQSGLRARLDALMGSSPFADPFFDQSIMDDFFGGSFGGAFGPRGQAVRASTDRVVLNVQPRADSALGERWLPAQDLAIVELWGEGQAQPPSLRVGEPVERIVALRARGVTATQLPEPVLQEAEGFKQYNQPARTDTAEENGEMVAIRALPSTLIPTEPGEYTLPPVAVTWWDTDEDIEKTTTLPARTVQVLPAAGQAMQAQVAPPSPGGPIAPEDGTPPGPAEPTRPAETLDLGLWGLGGLGAFFLIGWGRWFVARRRQATPPAAGGWGRRQEIRHREKALAKACREGDPLAAEAALVDLGRWLWPEASIASARDLALHLEEDELETEITLLLSSRYAADQKAWNGDSLWAAWRLARRRAKPRARKASFVPLPALHPES